MKHYTYKLLTLGEIGRLSKKLKNADISISDEDISFLIRGTLLNKGEEKQYKKILIDIHQKFRMKHIENIVGQDRIVPQWVLAVHNSVKRETNDFKTLRAALELMKR